MGVRSSALSLSRAALVLGFAPHPHAHQRVRRVKAPPTWHPMMDKSSSRLEPQAVTSEQGTVEVCSVPRCSRITGVRTWSAGVKYMTCAQLQVYRLRVSRLSKGTRWPMKILRSYVVFFEKWLPMALQWVRVARGGFLWLFLISLSGSALFVCLRCQSQTIFTTRALNVLRQHATPITVFILPLAFCFYRTATTSASAYYLLSYIQNWYCCNDTRRPRLPRLQPRRRSKKQRSELLLRFWLCGFPVVEVGDTRLHLHTRSHQTTPCVAQNNRGTAVTNA